MPAESTTNIRSILASDRMLSLVQRVKSIPGLKIETEATMLCDDFVFPISWAEGFRRIAKAYGCRMEFVESKEEFSGIYGRYSWGEDIPDGEKPIIYITYDKGELLPSVRTTFVFSHELAHHLQATLPGVIG